MPGKIEGVAIGDLFNMARRAAREAKMHEMRAATMAAATKKKALSESMAQNRSLSRMRAQTRAQLGIGMQQAGVNPALMMAVGGGGPGTSSSTDPATAALVAQAAAQGPRAGSMSMRGIGM